MKNGCFFIIIGIIAFIWISLEPISGSICLGIFIIIVIAGVINSNNKFNKEYETLMKQKEERESKFPAENYDYNNLSITHETKKEITVISCLKNVYDWINENTQLFVRENGENYFIIEAPNNTDFEIKINEKSEINVNIKRIIKQLEEYDGNENSKESFNFNYAASYMLDFPIFSLEKEPNEAEDDFHYLAEQLRELFHLEYLTEIEDNYDDCDDY